MREEIRAARWSASVAAVSGLIGALIGAGVTAAVNYQNLEAQRAAQKVVADLDRDAKAREQRRPVYVEFSEAANEWATRQAAASECTTLQVCEFSQLDLDNSRYRFQVAVNDMHLYGSAEGLEAARAVAGTLPPSLVGLQGHAVVEPVDEEDYSDAIVAYYDQMCIDLSYAPEDCNLGD